MRNSRCLLFFCTMALPLFCAVALAEAFNLPDSDQRKCYQSVDPYAEIPCANTGQDGEYLLNPLSYTDNANGTITDNNTGLIWQKQDYGGSYNWYEAAGVYHEAYNPTSTDVCGGLNLGGHSDWRLPSKKELMTIVDYAVPYLGPTVNPLFTNTSPSNLYWASTPLAYGNAWTVFFGRGEVYYYLMHYSGRARCVRGEQTQQNLVDNGNGTVKDNRTGLTWEQDEAGYMTWGAALSYCEGLALGGSTDWRLPNIKELESLTDDTRFNPAINTAFFPNAYASYYGSSTTSNGFYQGVFRSVNFTHGDVYDSPNKDLGAYYRCVRGGQAEALNQKPMIGSLTPSSIVTTAGAAQKFRAVYRDANGHADLKTVEFRANPIGGGAPIWTRYEKATNKLRLYNDAGTKLLAGSCAPGAAGSLQNSRVKLNCGKTVVYATDDRLIMNWSITPKPGFGPSANLLLRALDNQGATSGWKTKGTWTINP